MASDEAGAGAKAQQLALRVDDARIVGAEEAPDLYIEGYQSATLHHNVVKVNAYVLGFDPEAQAYFRRIVARLTMPLQSFVNIHDAFGELIKDLEAQGLIKRVKGAPDAHE